MAHVKLLLVAALLPCALCQEKPDLNAALAELEASLAELEGLEGQLHGISAAEPGSDPFSGSDFGRRPSGRRPDEQGMRMAASIFGICIDALKCMAEYGDTMEGKFETSMRKVAQEYQAKGKTDELRKLGPAAILLAPELVDILCDAHNEMTEQCVSQCPPEDGSLYSVATVSTEFICNERRAEVKAALPCYAKMFPKVGEGHCWGSCGDPEQVVEDWRSKFQDAMKNPPPLKKIADMALGDNGVLGTACSFGSCMLTCFEDLAESECGERDHGELIREVVQGTVRESSTLVSDLHLDCLIPDTCYALAGAPTKSQVWWIVIIVIVVVLLLLCAAGAVVYFLMKKRRNKARTQPYTVDYGKE